MMRRVGWWLASLALWPVAAAVIYAVIITWPLHGLDGNAPDEDELERWRDHGW